MRVTFVYPRFEKFLEQSPESEHELANYFLGDFTTPPSLGIPIMAALTPPDVSVELIDDNAGDPLESATDPDLVAINCFTPQATRAFEIADYFRDQGRLVVMGGFFPSAMPDECLTHATAVCIGEVEPVWSDILADARAGSLKPRYRGGCTFDLAKLPIPKREIFYDKSSYDWDEDLVQLTRGCHYTCAMCAIPTHMGSRIRIRPIPKVLEELRSLKFENVYLADDTLFFPQRRMVRYATELFEAVAPLAKKFFVSSTMALNTDPAFLDLAARAGVRNFYCTMNVDPVSIKALRGEAKEQQQLVDLVKMIEDRGIRFFGSCALGRDWDDTSIAERILELFDRAGINTSEFFLFTPYPGSVHWDRLERQGRIIDRDWAHYNGAHVVARPQNMTEDELREQFHKVWSEFFERRKERHGASFEPATWENGVQVVGKPLQEQGVRGQAAITGIGLLSPLGSDPQTVLAALREGRHAIAPVTCIDASKFRTELGGELRDFDPRTSLTDVELECYEDRYLQYSVAAARMALADAELAWPKDKKRADVALVLGTCNGGLLTAEAEYAWKHGKTDKAFDEKMNLQAQLYGFGKALADALGVTGEAWVVTTACSSATAAMGVAQMLINRGYYRTVLLGAADTLCLANVAGFDGLKATSQDRTAPFSLPVGLNVGEGAAFWVLEDLEQAVLREARVHAKLVGHATSSDAYHPTTPDPRGDGVDRTLRAALTNADIPIDAIGFVNAHGTGTEANDKAESRGIARFTGEQETPVVSLKSFFGHCMGATGIIEATCGILAMNDGFIPPTLNYSEPRPGCPLDYVPNQPRTARYEAFVNANYAFGGNNAAAVITTRDHQIPARPAPDTRVVITGTGCMTACGVGTGAVLAAVRNGDVAISKAPFDLPRATSRLGGFVPDYEARDIDRRLDLSGMSPIGAFATAAARLALAEGALRVGPKNGDKVGIVMGVCNGPSEMAHMDSVTTSPDYAANIQCFSTIVANSTAGFASHRLNLKGVNMSLAPGHHAGLQSLAYGFEAVRDGRADAMLAGAADETFEQTYSNYDRIGFLYAGEAEADYRLRRNEPKRKVLGEGAAVLLLESYETAESRGTPILGEVLGYGMTMDAVPFTEPAANADGLAQAVQTALERAGVAAGDVDLVVWAPQGNAQDIKTLDALETVLGSRAGDVPLATTTFNTGYIESASILVSLAATLQAVADGNTLWPQRTGDPALDNRTLTRPPRYMLALGSSDVGYNFAVVLSAA